MALDVSVDAATAIARQYFDDPAALHERFRAAQPFPHIVLDGFLDEAFARAMVDEFPSALGQQNPYGAPGRKAFHPDLKALGGAFERADRVFSSPALLAWLEVVTGISGLRYDPSNYGGGTHENFDGRDLRPHVDFNIHPVSKLHRRVNLIVYLNEGWDPAWGGAIALHRDPRDPDETPIAFAPDLNRCIIFATSERSWHGFEKIDLPLDQKHRSRRSLSLYYYSEERPEDEIVSEHTTFFVPRPAPSHYVAGHTLSKDDERDLAELFGQRDRLIALYQHEQGRREPWSAEAARLRRRCAELEAARSLPLLGYGRIRDMSGLFGDGWGGAEIGFTLRVHRANRSVIVRALAPEGIEHDTSLAIFVDGELAESAPIVPGRNEVRVPVPLAVEAEARIRLVMNRTLNPHARGLGADQRDLGIFVENVELVEERP